MKRSKKEEEELREIGRGLHQSAMKRAELAKERERLKKLHQESKQRDAEYWRQLGFETEQEMMSRYETPWLNDPPSDIDTKGPPSFESLLSSEKEDESAG